MCAIWSNGKCMFLDEMAWIGRRHQQIVKLFCNQPDFRLMEMKWNGIERWNKVFTGDTKSNEIALTLALAQQNAL